MLKRVAAFLALVLGLLGVVACCAGVYAVWLVGSRLERANETVFAAIDRGLAAVEDRVRGVRERVAESKITTSEVTQKLREWTTKKGKDRLVARFEVESRTEKLAGNLHMADVWLGTSAESVRDTQRLLELGQRLGAGADPASLDEVLERLLSARGKLQEAERAVVELREFATGNVGESEESRLARAAKILARILVTLGEVEPRLEASAARLSTVRDEAQKVMAKTGRSIALVTLGSYGLLAWISAGQIALYWWGWIRCRRNKSPVALTSPG